jgi:hypothetical protein
MLTAAARQNRDLRSECQRRICGSDIAGQRELGIAGRRVAILLAPLARDAL